VALAKIDANTYKSVGKRFNVSGFPTLKWFVNGEPSEYTGGRTDSTIVSWVQKRLGPATKHLPSPVEHDAFVSSADVVVVGYFEDAESERWKWFRSAAMDIDLAAFAHADGKAVHTHAGQGEGAIVLHKKFDGGVKLLYEGEQSTTALQARARSQTVLFSSALLSLSSL
jgi:protein disulfide-isomerase A1